MFIYIVENLCSSQFSSRVAILNDFNDVLNVLWFNYAVCCCGYRLLSSLFLLSPPFIGLS